MPPTSSPTPRRVHPRLEQLETRQLLSGFQPTPAEQRFLEQLNDARANPAAYGAAIGLDLSGVAPAPPLTFDPRLGQAARLHSQDMSDHGYFGHTDPHGAGPGERLSAAGVGWSSWGESVAAGPTLADPASALRALIVDDGVPGLGHRKQLLALDDVFRAQGQVGVGIVRDGGAPWVNYYTVDTADAPLVVQPPGVASDIGAGPDAAASPWAQTRAVRAACAPGPGAGGTPTPAQAPEPAGLLLGLVGCGLAAVAGWARWRRESSPEEAEPGLPRRPATTR